MVRRDGGTFKGSGKGIGRKHKRLCRKITAREVFSEAVAWVSWLLNLRMEGGYEAEDLASLLVEAASREVSLNQAAKDLAGAMAESNAPYHLGKLSLEELAARANDLLLEMALEVLPAKALLQGPSRVVGYTMASRRGGRREEVALTLYLVRRYEGDRRRRRRGRYYVYAVRGVALPLARVWEEYRRRFGIESSYRQMNDSRARTATRDPARRLLFAAVAFLLVNLWIYLKWTRLFTPRRGPGGRDVLDALFPLESMLVMLSEAVGRAYGRRREVTIPGG